MTALNPALEDPRWQLISHYTSDCLTALVDELETDHTCQIVGVT